MIVGHAFGMLSVTGLVILCTLLPFIPGRYDRLAVPFAAMAQVFGITGLLLVPIGSLWIASAHVNRFRDKQRAFAIAALVVSSFVWAAVSLSALVYVGISLLICAFAL